MESELSETGSKGESGEVTTISGPFPFPEGFKCLLLPRNRSKFGNWLDLCLRVYINSATVTVKIMTPTMVPPTVIPIFLGCVIGFCILLLSPGGVGVDSIFEVAAETEEIMLVNELSKGDSFIVVTVR